MIEHDDPNTTSETVQETLLRKHPPNQLPKQSFIITADPEIVDHHPVLFAIVHSTALIVDGAAGHSGLDAAAWKRLCSSFKSASADLCDSLSALGRRICSCYACGLIAFVSCRLIALNKFLGVRPIGIGETVRRIIGKNNCNISNDIQDAAGPLQVCAGHLSGCEATVHAMRHVFEAQTQKLFSLLKHQMPSTH